MLFWTGWRPDDWTRTSGCAQVAAIHASRTVKATPVALALTSTAKLSRAPPRATAGSSQHVVRTSGVSWTPLSTKGGAEMEKPARLSMDGSIVEMVFRGCCRLGRCGQ
jgi:hypothetical protein